MCGRFTQRSSAETVSKSFDVQVPDQLPLRYNVAPTQTVAVVRQSTDDGRELVMLRWGLIPSWSKDIKIGNRLINARGETAAEKPSFRAAFKRRRCLIIADGYYEWEKMEDGPKQPWLYHREDDSPFAFAGLWERWDKEEDPIESCTIITTEANDLASEVHNRMPVILQEDAFDLWLDPEVQDARKLQRLLAPAPEDYLVADKVSTLVNNPRNDKPECIAPL